MTPVSSSFVERSNGLECTDNEPSTASAESTASTEANWDRIVGQPVAVARLRAAVNSPVHAYLLVGPKGVGKRRAATIFGGELLANDATDIKGAQRHRRLALSENHPDMHVVDPAGNSLRRDPDAEALIAEASRSPVEGARKVLVVNRFHTATATAAAALLKIIEEPPPTSIFVLISEQIPPEHITIASRCTRIELGAVRTETITAALVAEGLADYDNASMVALVANGNMERARLLATDDRLVARRDAWWSIPDRLDGTGAAVALLVAEVRELIDQAELAGNQRHKDEMQVLAEQSEALGLRTSPTREFEIRRRREQRQLRTDELRFGLATLAARYREMIVKGDERRSLLTAVDDIRQATSALIRNPNEALVLQSLFGKLPLS